MPAGVTERRQQTPRVSTTWRADKDRKRGSYEPWLPGIHASPVLVGHLPALPKLIADLPEVVDENLWLDRLMQRPWLNVVDLEREIIVRKCDTTHKHTKRARYPNRIHGTGIRRQASLMPKAVSESIQMTGLIRWGRAGGVSHVY